MGLLKGIANIVAKGKRPVSLKTKVITATAGITIAVISAAFLGGIIKETRQSHAQKLQTDIYTSLGLDEDGDLSELIEIKGNEYTGYYLSFVEDIDEKLEQVLEDNDEVYDALDVKDISTLKKFIKAQMVTQYPNLGSSIYNGTGDETPCELAISQIGKPYLAGEESPEIGFDCSGIVVWAYQTAGYDWGGQRLTADGFSQIGRAISRSELSPGDLICEGWNGSKYTHIVIYIGDNQVVAAEARCTLDWSLHTGSMCANGCNVWQRPMNADELNGTNNVKYITLADYYTGTGEEEEEEEVAEGEESVEGEEETEETDIEIDEEGEETEETDTFQGAIRIRRVTPNKSIGEYRDTTGVNIEVDNEGNTGEGLGKEYEISDSVKEQIIETYSIPEDAQNALNNLSYLIIPYIDFNGAVQEGTMIVSSNLADEVLAIFQELYNIKYPIENLDTVENFDTDNNEDKSIEYLAVDENDTYSYYYAATNAQLTGNAIVLNPQYNPNVQDGKTEHSNASRYVNRDNTDNWSAEAKSAYIDKESQVYEIFKKYGWTWGGEDEENPNYGYFEKTTTNETDSEETTIDSRVYDLKYVPEDIFNEYIENNDSQALNVFTLDEDMKLTTATWSYSTAEGLKISKGKTINYKNALSKYDMPVEYLLTMLTHTEDKVFCEGLADLAIESEYIIAIEDKVTTVQTTVRTNTVTTHQNAESGYVSTLSSTENVEVTVNETATQTAEVTYVDCWYFRFSKDYSYSTEYLQNASTGGHAINLSGTPGEYIGDFQITAYCSCGICCGKYSPENGGSGLTSSGTVPQAGLTIASNILPEGAYVMFNNHVYHVEDTGNGLPGNWIDLYMNSHQEALNWGVRTLPVYWAENVEGQEGTADNEGTDENSEEDSEDEETTVNSNPISVNINAMGKINKSESTNVEGPTSTDSITALGNYITTTTTVTTTTGTISYTYDTGEAQRSGNSEKFVKLYNDEDCKNVRSITHVPWLVESLEESSKTANMVEITQYLFAQASGKNYGTSSLVFEEYDPGDFENASGTAGLDTFIEWLHAMENHTGLSADGTMYLIGDDGYGNVTVGYGVDIFNGGFADRFAAAGYSTEEGAYVPVEFVDSLEREEIETCLDAVMAKTAGLNLTQYQIYALTSRAYNCGIDGAFDVRNGKTFEQAYLAYWNQETDDQYKEPPNDDMYNHRLYTLYMSMPNTVKTAEGSVYSQGLENRRKSEWLLFKTGYYDRIDKYCSIGEGNGDFLEVAKEVWMEVCTSGRYTTYGGSNIPCTGPTIDCSSYVSWVLYEYGYTEFAGGQANTQIFYETDWTAKYGWEQISVGSGENPIDILQPGDLFVRYGSGTHHITLVVEITDDGRILCYDCGSTSANWNGTDGSPMDKSYFLTKAGAGKIMRVTEP